MAYKISYGETPKVRKKFSKNWMAAFAIVVFAIVMKTIGLDAQLRNVLIPGDAAVTAAAFENMLNNLAQGQPIADVFGGFCKEIICGAQIY